MVKYEQIEAIEDEDSRSAKNIQIMQINALLFIAEELSKHNDLKTREISRLN